MSDKDEQPDAGLDDFDKASRLNFRDYPSTSLVMIAALSSGLGWMAYKWLGRKRAGQRVASDGIEGDGGQWPQGRSSYQWERLRQSLTAAHCVAARLVRRPQPREFD
jgi:hypothetical protein